VKRHKQRDPVTEDLAIEVFTRDGGCIAYRLDPEHGCLGRLTIEHVPIRGQNALGKRGPSSRYHLLSLCLLANSGTWAETHREVERSYLEVLYPGHDAVCVCREAA
jgi:hypothetical protein